jgi:type I restriction enzyme S subunit
MSYAPPEDAPTGWAFCTFSDVTSHHAGNSKLIKGKQFGAPTTRLYPGFSASGQDVWLDHWEQDGVAIIISAVGARCGKCFFAQGKWSAIANTHVVWPDPNAVDPKFLWWIVTSENVQTMVAVTTY